MKSVVRKQHGFREFAPFHRRMHSARGELEIRTVRSAERHIAQIDLHVLSFVRAFERVVAPTSFVDVEPRGCGESRHVQDLALEQLLNPRAKMLILSVVRKSQRAALAFDPSSQAGQK
jgi:hypothetical protein